MILKELLKKGLKYLLITFLLKTFLGKYIKSLEYKDYKSRKHDDDLEELENVSNDCKNFNDKIKL